MSLTKKISTIPLLFFLLLIPNNVALAEKTSHMLGTVTVYSEDNGKTFTTYKGQDVTALYNKYNEIKSKFPNDSPGSDLINTEYKSNDGSYLLLQVQPDSSLTMKVTLANGAFSTFDSKMNITSGSNSPDMAFIERHLAAYVANTDTAGPQWSVKQSEISNLVNSSNKNNPAPKYINDGTQICTPTGCTYTLMAPIGDLLGKDGVYKINKNDKNGLCSLLNSWFRIGIALAGMLAVVMIVLGGFQYATTDSLFGKEDGKGKIQNALWGLMLALTTWVIINTINPALTKCEINAVEVQLSALSVSGVLGGDVMSLGLLGANNALVAAGSAGGNSTKSQSQIDAEYANAYAGWTDADAELLKNDPNNAGALAKWEGIQMQIDSLDNIYANVAPTAPGGSASTVPGVTDNGWAIYNAALANTNTCQTNLKNLGCANSVYNTLDQFGYSIGPGDSTIELNKTLSKSSDWVKVDGGLSNSLPGDIVVSPTVGSMHGHTGFVTGIEGATIVSNSGGTMKQNYTATSWTKDLEGSRNLTTVVYRRK